MHGLTESLFDLQHSLSRPFLESVHYPWEILPALGGILSSLIAELPSGYRELAPGIWVGEGTRIESTALLKGPAIIGRNCDIRHAAFIRENVLLGDEVVVGNSTEVKNAVLFDGVQVPHFNYVGDSILGYKAHLGAGAILSNFKAAGDMIFVQLSDGTKRDTGLNKLGGLIGDFAEIGCNAVLFPGTIVGRQSIIYPLCPARGFIPAGQILKNDGKLYPKS
ncbi:MAG: UDP-N-acetylglucosamine pyrophosphorylase [Haliscomenobacter sp.]|nr:UDP-N-acetylglucosamine pyrophosphorylase [Haliscomenobacter sp.]MBK8879896.1 UDP-N-acetylglucosamine pyrophosphorylase [Haliscomenobacter sp.]